MIRYDLIAYYNKRPPGDRPAPARQPRRLWPTGSLAGALRPEVIVFVQIHEKQINKLIIVLYVLMLSQL